MPNQPQICLNPLALFALLSVSALSWEGIKVTAQNQTGEQLSSSIACKATHREVLPSNQGPVTSLKHKEIIFLDLPYERKTHIGTVFTMSTGGRSFEANSFFYKAFFFPGY